jgi:pyruvate/2-oxoglutarate dehydrogenase complex dihydrolipoamide dehydrogenase (E3) component
LRAEKFILCAGGHARRLSFPGAEHALTHSDVWSLKALPASMIVVGGAATGCQLASVFAAFGSRITLLDLAPRIVPGEDALVSQTLTEALSARGITLITGIDGLDAIEADGARRTLVYRHQGATRRLEASAIVLSVGWLGNIDSLNLAAAGIESDGRYVRVNDQLQTSAPHIYAAGDITGRMMLVQSASDEARVAAENAVRGSAERSPHRIVPHGGFTDPEYGSVGPTEAVARAAGPVASAVVSYAELDRGVIDGHTEGMCKLLVDAASHKLLGAHVVGEQAAEIVHVVAAGMAAGMTVQQLAELEISYPTYTAILGLAARRIAQSLDLTATAPQWRMLGQTGSDWERHD